MKAWVPSVVDAPLARHWCDRWEDQQQLYAGDREERFESVLDVVQAVRARPRVIVDLGSGPGSLALRAARRFPDATVVAVDQDPLLLALGTAAHPQLVFVQADIGADGWTMQLAKYAGSIDAIISSTALHYPTRKVLDGIYRDCYRLLGTQSILVDADQFYPTNGRWRQVLSASDDIRARRTRRAAPEDWDRWWRSAESEPAFAPLLARRAHEVPAHERDNELSMEDHVVSMRSAGFVAAGPVWQHGRSAVIAALTASTPQIRTDGEPQ